MSFSPYIRLLFFHWPPTFSASASKMDPPTLSFRGCRIVDSFMGMDGEGTEDSTRTGDRGIFISDDGERRSETLRNVIYKKRRIRLRPEALNDSLAQWIPVLDDAELSEDLRATLDSISADAGTAGSGKRKTYDSSVSTA
jgi:hypothetical protein